MTSIACDARWGRSLRPARTADESATMAGLDVDPAYQAGGLEADAAWYRIHFKPALQRPELLDDLVARLRCIGYDSTDPVSSMYPSGFPFANGEIVKVVFDIADDAYVDVEAHLAAAMARD